MKHKSTKSKLCVYSV